VKRPYRVVVAKPGLDGHDRGAKVIARALRDAGFEVIYTGLHQTADQVVQAVIQEDADAVGLSLLSGAHLTLVPRVIDGLKEQGRDDVLVLVGGIIPEADIPVLKEMGVAEVFTPGAPLPAIGTWLGEALDERRSTGPHAGRGARVEPVATARIIRSQSNKEHAEQAERNGSGGSLRIPG
jgi:methylmalonyl-CoA mutase C-terminal domain/subunit